MINKPKLNNNIYNLLNINKNIRLLLKLLKIYIKYFNFETKYCIFEHIQ